MTVGVAPGTYTLQLGGCPPDEVSSGAWGVPRYGWYDVSSPYISYDEKMAKNPLDPYGTQSTLKGLDLTTKSAAWIAIGGFVALYAVWYLAKSRR